MLKLAGKTSRSRRERGFALLMVLWTLVLLSFLATVYGGNARTEVLLARNLVENAQAEMLAETGIYRAVAGLNREPADGGFRGDGAMYTLHTDEGEVRFSVRDEGGKIDLNTASDALLRALFDVLEFDPDQSSALADAIVDFRDEDDEKLPSGAEARQYVAAGLGYGPKNQRFEVTEELTYVLGMTPEIYRRILPLVTVHGQEEQPHEVTATPEVREALLALQDAPRNASSGFGRGSTARGSLTSGTLGSTGTSSRNTGAGSGGRSSLGRTGFDSPGSFSRSSTSGFGSSFSSGSAGGGSFADLDELGSAFIDEDLRDRSGLGIYTIHAEGRTRNGTVSAREATVTFVGSDEAPYAFYAWRQGERQLFPLQAGDRDGG